MSKAVVLAEIWRGGFLESQHLGHAVVADGSGEIVAAWGDAERVILPRSACKMVQALALVESGAAEAAGLGSEQLALACASHNGAAMHTSRVARWLADLGLGDEDLRCGAHMPRDAEAKKALLCADEAPRQWHNNCSGKHAGFLTLNRHLSGGPEYVEADHPVQEAMRAAFEEVTGEASPGFAIDGCSAPNFATSLTGLARAMARFARAGAGGSVRERAMVRLREAMARHPELVAGEGRACTRLMRAMKGRAMVKTGAEAVFVAILPERGLGIALKVDDGGSRASEAAIAALLGRFGALDPADPVARAYTDSPLTNWRGIECGRLRAAETLRTGR